MVNVINFVELLKTVLFNYNFNSYLSLNRHLSHKIHAHIDDYHLYKAHILKADNFGKKYIDYIDNSIINIIY